MKKQVSIIASFLIVTGIISCSKGSGTSNTTVDCSGTAKSYASDVSPVISAYCASSGCHASGSSNGPGALTTYQQVYNARVSIRSAVLNGSMPQGSSLSSTQRNAIICWIDSGAANN